MISSSSRVLGLFTVMMSLSGLPALAQQAPATKPAGPPSPSRTTPTSEQQPVQVHVDDHNHSKPKSGSRIDAPFVPPTTRAKPKPEPKLPSNVVARVGNQDISRDDVLAMFNMVGGRPIVDQIVQATILEQEAKRLGVTVTAEELKKGIDEAKLRIVAQQGAQGEPMTFEEIAAREGYNDDLIRWSVRLDTLRRKTFAKAIENQVPTRDGQMHLAHILAATIALPKPNEEAKPLTPEEQKKKDEESKAKIERLLEEIKSGKRSWDEAAKESDDPSNAQSGGDLGWMAKGQLDLDFEKAAFAIQKSGEIVGPVKSRFGWHLIKLVQKGNELSAQEKADYRKQQITMMQNNPQQLNIWFNALRAKKQILMNRQAKIVPGARIPARMLQVTPSGKPTAPAKATRKASLR